VERGTGSCAGRAIVSGRAPPPRNEPLPWQQPKASAEDPEAERRVRAILASPSYRQADADGDFMLSDETRGVRLQIDYAKAEGLLQAHGVERTVVVFGSTRIQEPAAAQRQLATLSAALALNPGDASLQRRLAVAERMLAKSHYYDIAREFGRRVAGASCGTSRVAIMTGGGPGLMEAANRGAFDVGVRSVGLNITLPHDQYPNPYVAPELCFRFHYFALRKLHFLKRACALVAFPGGYGTLDELFETLTLIQTRKIQPVPVVLVGEPYWRRMIDFDFMVDEGVIAAEDRALFWFAETAEQTWDSIQAWHVANDTPLHAAASTRGAR